MSTSVYYEDDFAEASIEAISLAAFRTSSALPQPAPDEHEFPSTSAPRGLIRRALSTLSARTRSDIRGPSFVSSPVLSVSRAEDSETRVRFSALGEWWRDVVVMPHNALKAEVMDLRRMVSVVGEGGEGMAGIAEWWKGFDLFLGGWFTFEEEVLLPWVFKGEGGGGKRDMREKMKVRRGYVRELAMEVANVFVLMDGVGNGGDIVGLLSRVTKEFTKGLLVFLDMEEAILPGLIKAGRGSDEAFNVCRLLCRRMDIVLLTRWLPTRKERVKIRSMYMNPTSLLYFWARRKRVFTEHIQLARAIYSNVGVR